MYLPMNWLSRVLFGDPADPVGDSGDSWRYRAPYKDRPAEFDHQCDLPNLYHTEPTLIFPERWECLVCRCPWMFFVERYPVTRTVHHGLPWEGRPEKYTEWKVRRRYWMFDNHTYQARRAGR